jgi:hypothetical protein
VLEFTASPYAYPIFPLSGITVLPNDGATRRELIEPLDMLHA